ncbi:hypothetical protein CBR_g44607 [Chara braunii]|uniref:BLUF domain-containing protein n=1 Tax=Chara braunii TaxID=69332 RepID=A0A388LY62_CHABU|nr:hypothetical protein CBR_g44607 [Chara braunii]|eukprot:GBG87149.1 hypothetical protein CBR_g44607 [Chara braunii]
MMDDAIEPPHVSLLDVVLERIQKEGKKVLLARVVYIAKTGGKESNKTQQISFHEELMNKVKGDSGEKVTGMLLVFPTCCVHVMEAETKIVLDILRELLHTWQQQQQAKTRVLDMVKIVSFTEDIPGRAFPTWMSAFLSSSNAGPYEAEEEAKILAMACNLNISMVKLGTLFSEMSKPQQIFALDNLKSTAGDLLPKGPEVIFGMLLSEETPTLEEFMEIYDDPINVDLDSENVWPMAQPLKFEL